jgi:hypothetical protein
LVVELDGLRIAVAVLGETAELNAHVDHSMSEQTAEPLIPNLP